MEKQYYSKTLNHGSSIGKFNTCKPSSSFEFHVKHKHGEDHESQAPAKGVVEKLMAVADKEITLEQRRKIKKGFEKQSKYSDSE
ncbi:unnamed protein product [Trifolium pratense]|uniref:Uncharacterized protein n=1 Tax=Trifolium pratense TaxID=57577 RepID=A0ACB0KQW5_TRIPR|nr:unnamed protein product [Trifolium pratense]